MFFKKLKTDVEDDYDDDFEDDWDDFDLDGGGYNDTTPKSGVREAVTQVTGSFFKGIKDSLLSPVTHRKLLRETLPEGYVSAYDDIDSLRRSTKGLYDTVKNEAMETHDEYMRELSPLLQKYDQKKQSKLSGKLAKHAAKARRSVPPNQISEEEMAYTAAANEIFGTAMQRQSTDAITGMANSFEQSSAINQNFNEQQTEIMLNQTNALNKTNAFNEQVALRFKQKSLELQFKHYFTARKHLEINTQQLDYLKATLPDLVKNTGLPDAVKINLSEQATNMFKGRLIGKVQDFSSEKLTDVFGDVTKKASGYITQKLNQVKANAGSVASAADMLSGSDDGFGMTPKDMAIDMFGGYMGDMLVNKVIDKSKDWLKEKAENSGTDFEGNIQKFNAARASLLPMIKKTIEKGGTGNFALDDFLMQSGIFDRLTEGRDPTLQKNLSDSLQEQALFDLETKKSITSTIPGLLSEIHSEINVIRSSFGMPEPDNDSKLKMDWDTGILNTKGNIKTKLANKLFDEKQKTNNHNIAAKGLSAFGFDENKILNDKQVADETGKVLLSEKDLIELSKYMKAKAYRGEEFDEVELAKGASEIEDEEARKNIAKFMTDVLTVDASRTSINESTEPMREMMERINSSTDKQNLASTVFRNMISEYSKEGYNEKEYLKALTNSNAEEMLELGSASLSSNGSIIYDAKGHQEALYSKTREKLAPGETFRGQLNNEYGAQTRVAAFDQKLKDKIELEENEKKAQLKRGQLIKQFQDQGILAKGVSRFINAAKGDFSYLADKITEEQKDQLFPITAAKGTMLYYRQVAQRKYLRARVTTEEVKEVKDQENGVSPIPAPDAPRPAPVLDTSVLGPAPTIGSSDIPAPVLNAHVLGPLPTPTATPTPAPVVNPIVDAQPPASPSATGGALTETTQEEPAAKFNWQTFLSDKLKLLFDNILGEFTNQDYVSIAKGITEGIKEFMKRIAEKGLPEGNNDLRIRELEINADNQEYGDDYVGAASRAAAEISSYTVNTLLDYLDGNQVENRFFGGTVGGGFSGAFKHFRKGGKVKKNSKQKRYFKEIESAKRQIDDAISSRKFSPAKMQPAPLLKAMERERQLGGDPQVIVASTGEQVLSTANGDAQTFQAMEKDGLWNKIKTSYNAATAEREGDGELTGLFRQLGREVAVEAPQAVGKAKKAISETKEEAKKALDEHGAGAALFIRDIRAALGDESAKDLTAEDAKFTKELKDAADDITNLLATKLGGGKQAAEEFWKNFQANCEKEGTTANEAIKKLKAIKEDAEAGRLKPVFDFIKNKNIAGKLQAGYTRFKSAINLEGTKDAEGRVTIGSLTTWGKDRASATGNAAVNLKDSAVDYIDNFDAEEAKSKAQLKAMGAYYRSLEVKDKATEKAGELKDKFMEKTEGIRGKAKDGFKALKGKATGMLYDENGEPIFNMSAFKDMKMPNLALANKSAEGLATISRQMAELIRTNALIAIGTGSSPEDAAPSDPESIKAFAIDKDGNLTKVGASAKGFFGKLKAKLGKKDGEELDEDGNPVEPKTRYAKFKAWMRRKSTVKEVDPNDPKITKKQGNRLLSVKASLGQWLRNRKNAGKNAGDPKKEFKDIYLKGQKDPVITGLELSKGLYTKADGQVIKSIDEIEGAILDLSSNVIISQEEFDKGLVIFKNARGFGIKGLFKRKNKTDNGTKSRFFSFFKRKESNTDGKTNKKGLLSFFKRNKAKDSKKYKYPLDIVDLDGNVVIDGKDIASGKLTNTTTGAKVTSLYEIYGDIVDENSNLLASYQNFLDDKYITKRSNYEMADKEKVGLGNRITGFLHRGKGAKGSGISGRVLFNNTSDVYNVEDMETPVLTAKGFKNNEYFDKKGTPITKVRDIEGDVFDKDGNLLVSKDDFKNKRLVLINGKPIQTKKHGLIRSSFGAAGSVIGGANKAGWWLTKKIFKTAWWTVKRPFKAAAWIGKKAFGVNMAEDVYKIGEEEPVLLAKDMKKGNYLDKETGKPITCFKDITGAVVDSEGNTVITKEDVVNKRLLTMGGITRKSFASTVVGGSMGAMGWMMDKTWRVVTKPFRMLLDNKGKSIRKKKSEFILFDIYVSGDEKPKILAKEVQKDAYFDVEGNVVNKYSQLDKPVYDKDKNVLISEEDIKKGLVTFDGTPIGKIAGGFFKGLGKTIGFGFGATAGIFKGMLSLSKGTWSLFGGAFKFSTKVGKKLFGALNNGFDVDGRDKYALMIQAQAASVDKLEAIRLILDQRMTKTEGKFNDKDGDGTRDGSYMDVMRKKAKAKEDKEAKAKEKDAKKGDKEKSKEVGKGLLDALDSPWTKLIAGGLMYAFGPQLVSAVTMSVRSILPSWLGGLSDERKDEIERNGGIFATALKEGKGHKKGERTGKADDPTTETDESVYQEADSGTPLWQKLAMGYLGYKGISAGLKWGAKKAIGAGLTRLGIGAASTAVGTGLAGAAGATGVAGTAGALGTAAAGGTLAAGATGVAGAAGAAGATGAAIGGTALGSAAVAQGAAVTGAVTAGSGAGIMAGLTGLAGAAGAALMSPVGLGILTVLAAGALLYGGYRVYKALTKKDSHLAEWRMAQYGYKIDDKDHVTKILDLEDYLSKCTTKATNSQYAKINGQADINEAIKIFGIISTNQEDVNKFLNWFHYRFKQVYLAWKTVMQRKLGDDDISKIDEKLLKADKISLVNEVSFGSAGSKIYSVLQSPFPGEKEVKLGEGQVYSIKKTVLEALEAIDGEKHDDQILKKGGGKNKNVSSTEEQRRVEATKAAGATGKANGSISGTAQETAALRAAQQQQDKERQNKPPEDTQSWWRKMLYGDNATDEGKGLSLTDKIGDGINNFFSLDGGKAAGSTVDFAKTFTKGVTINGLTEAQTAAMAANTAETESRFRMGVRNKQGYSGLYQFGGEALAEVGYMRKVGGGWRQQNAAMSNSSNWLNGLSLQKFLSSRELQDRAYVALVNKNLQYGRGIGGAKFDALMRDYHQVAKYAKMAHLKGAGNAVKGLLYGRDAADGNGTSMIQYGNKAAANVDAILKAMGDGKPVSNAMSDNPAIRMGQKAGESVRNAASKVWNNVTGKTPATPATPATKLPNKPGVAPEAIAKPTQQPASNSGGLLGLTGIGGIKSNLVDDAPVVEQVDMPDETTSFTSNFTDTNTGYVDKKGNFSVVPTANTVKAKPVAKDSTTLLAKVTKGTPISPVVNTGNFSVAKSGTGVSSRGYKAARYARSHARGKSIGRCANYVATALLSGGYSFTRQPSAYMYHTNNTLTNAGFTQIVPNAQWIPGDVIVINRFSGHPHGHICIWDGRNWVSDFIQRRYTPYSSGTPGGWALYRDTQTLNGAKVASGWCQGTPGGGASVNTIDSDGSVGGLDATTSSDANTNGQAQTKYKTNTNIVAATKGKGNRTYSNSEMLNGTKGVKKSTPPVSKPSAGVANSNVIPKSNWVSDLTSNFAGTVKDTKPKVDSEGSDYSDTNYLIGQDNYEPKLELDNNLTSNFSANRTSSAKAANLLDQKRKEDQAAVQMQVQQQQAQLQSSDQSVTLLKEQLYVQKQIAKDISEMVKVMTKLQQQTLVAQESKTSSAPVAKTDTPPPTQNRRSRTIETMEPVSMKIQ